MGKEPLVEVAYPEFEILEKASEKNQGRMKIKSLMAIADTATGNGRVYPENIMDREVAKLQEQIKQNAAYGSADHSQDGKSRIQDVAVMLTSLAKNAKKEYYGEMLVLSTAKGKDVAAILEAGGRLGVSSRGFGTTKPGMLNGKKVETVGADYKLRAFDLVIGQATEGASFQLEAHDDVALFSIFESEEEDGDDDFAEMTLEELKRDRPDVIEALKRELVLKDEIKSDVSEEVIQARVEKRLAEERDEIREALVQEIKDRIVLGEFAVSSIKLEDLSEDAKDKLLEQRQRRIAGFPAEEVIDHSRLDESRLSDDERLKRYRQRRIAGLEAEEPELSGKGKTEDPTEDEKKAIEDRQRRLAGLPAQE